MNNNMNTDVNVQVSTNTTGNADINMTSNSQSVRVWKEKSGKNYTNFRLSSGSAPNFSNLAAPCSSPGEFFFRLSLMLGLGALTIGLIIGGIYFLKVVAELLMLLF